MEERLTYGPEDRCFPIPPAERGIQTVEAELVTKVDLGAAPGLNILEGLAFDGNGGLFFCQTPAGRIYRYDLGSGETRLWKELPDSMLPSAIKFHKNGTLYVTCAYSNNGPLVAVLSPTGEIMDRLLEGTPHMIDDMVFDRDGGFFCTDLAGNLAHPTSGVFRVAAGGRTLEPIATGMAATNGIALSPDWKVLWVTEYGTGRLHRFELATDHTGLVTVGGSHIPYHFTGYEGPDSACIDADGNLYVALCGQGRFLVFNPAGIPIGQVLVPGREEGRMLKSTHPQIRPGTDELYLCSADMKTGEAALFKTRAFAPAFPGFAFSR